jgi:hypothetical protein
VGFAKINAVIFGLFKVAVLGRKQVLIPHPLAVPVIKFWVLDYPPIRGTRTWNAKHHNAKDNTEKIHYKWFRAQPMLNANIHFMP